MRLGAGLGRAAEVASVRTGLGSGGVIGGRVLLRLAPDAVRTLSGGRDVVLVSGTNGKTTTSSYVAACLRCRGEVDSNADGANTPAGIARALARGRADTVVLETDEGWLPWTVDRTEPSTVVLLNLSRDQLHRHHEVAALATTWHAAMGSCAHVVANCDDPDVVFAALGAARQTWVAAGRPWNADAVVCPRCGDECRHAEEDWYCEACGLRRPRPHWWLEGRELRSGSARVLLDLGLPGSVNLGNAAMAVATAEARGVDPGAAASALQSIASVAGRYEVREHAGRRARLLLAKNPASWQEALRLVGPGEGPVVLVFNSEGVDGRDPSWLYDVQFEALGGRQVVVTGRRATDMLVRLEMAGIEAQSCSSVMEALESVPPGTVDLIANYTAFQHVLRQLPRDA